MSPRLAGWVLGIAVVTILATLIASLIGGLDKSSDVANVVAAVVTAISTVAVAFFGIHVAEAGRQDAEKARRRSEQLHLSSRDASGDSRLRKTLVNERPS
jgi:cobalamin biosynthesis protein CobD/CbiB